MDNLKTAPITEEIERLARQIRRFLARNETHVNRLDRLRLILLENDGISLRGLARLLDIRPPSVTEWVEKLTQDGEITRERDQDDKRVVRISLTEKGRELAHASKQKKEESGGIFAGFLADEEAEAFVETCRKLTAYLSKQDDAHGGQGDCEYYHWHRHPHKSHHHDRHRHATKEPEEESNG